MTLRLTSLVTLSLLSLVAGPVAAQEEPALQQVVTVKVKPGRDAGVEEYVSAVRRASQELGMENYWLASQSVSGEPIYTFTVQRGSWADLSQPSVQARFVEVFGERETTRLANVFADSVESTSTAFYTTQPALSVQRQVEGDPDAVLYVHFTLNPGMTEQFTETQALYHEANLAVAPDAASIFQTPNFGSGFRLVAIFESWSTMGTGNGGPQQRLIQHFGPEAAAAIIARRQEAISETRLVLNRTRPDLNYQPED